MGKAGDISSPGGGSGLPIKNSRDRAANQAQNMHLSQFAEVLTNSNLVIEKQLQEEIRCIEMKKRARASEIFISQRQFFIDKMFDQKNDLRFVKVKNHRALDRGNEASHPNDGSNPQNHNRQSSTGSSIPQSSNGTASGGSAPPVEKTAKPNPSPNPVPFLTMNDRKASSRSLTNKLFLNDAPADGTTSANMNLIRHAQSRLLERRGTEIDADHVISSASPALFTRRNTSEGLVTMLKNDINDNVLHETKDTTTKIPKLMTRSARNLENAKNQVTSRSSSDDNDREAIRRLRFKLVIAKKQSSKDVQKIKDEKDKLIVVDVDKPKFKICKLSVENVRKLEKSFCQKETRLILLKRLLEDVSTLKQVKPDRGLAGEKIFKESLGFRRRETLHERLGIATRHADKDTISNASNLEQEKEVRQEKLIRKLTRSLPVHLLVKAEQQTHNLVDVLGYSSRNQRMLQGEKKVSGSLGQHDTRFDNLVHSLAQT